MKSFKLSDRIYVQFGRFFIVGLAVAIIDFGVFFWALELHLPRRVANFIGMTCGFIAGFFGHQYFTFKIQNRPTWGVFCRYGITFICNLFVGIISLEILIYLEIGVTLSKLIAMSIVVASNFIISRYYVFITPGRR